MLNALTKHNYKDKKTEVTDGIQISKWHVPLDEGKSKLTYSMWDFAGQSVFIMHHMSNLIYFNNLK